MTPHRDEHLAQATAVAPPLQVTGAVRSAWVILPLRTSIAPSRCGLLWIVAKTTAPASKYTLPALCRSSEVTRSDARLPAQVEQLEDVVDSEFAQRAFDRHRSGGVGREDVLQVERGARVRGAPGARTARSGRAA